MASIENSEHGMPKQSGTADLIVKGAIALVTVAFFIGAYLQFQVTFWLALIAALSVYIMLLMVHALMRRSERESELVHEVNRLEDEVARLQVAPTPAVGARKDRAPAFAPPSPAGLRAPPAPPAPPAFAKAPAAPPAPAAPATNTAPPMPPMATAPPRIFRNAPPAAATEREPRLTGLRPGASAPEPQRSESHRPDPVLSVPMAPLAAEEQQRGPTLPDWSAAPGAPATSVDPMHDYWPARQSKPSLPEGPRVELPPMPSLAAERETDLDAVHGMIKRLADEVNVGAEPTLDGMPPRQESVLRASLNALQTTANAMRATKKKGGLPPVSTAPRAGAPMPPPIMPSHTRLASLAEAVAAGRIDVALSPIVGLADHQVHYYEVVACPRDERGTLLSATTRDPQLALAGLLPLLDSARLRQAARVARSFAEEGRATSLFAPATAVSLANDSFLDELADAYRDREALASELVLTFAQADVRTFGGSEWSALTDMRDLGFRFGVEDVTDFDYEFTALCAAGFAFVKLDAATLIGGLAAPNGTMGADEVCRNLGELGLTLIVGGVDDETLRSQVLAAGVPLGQGALYGAPVAVFGEDFAMADHAAA
jgi:EAL domain-containing protein (putative c-di-GMP-specific phosphodiesterase class I)